MPIFSGNQRVILIQAFGPSCGLRPLADGKKTNIYAVVRGVRSGQDAFAQIGLRLGGFEARSGQKRIRSTGTRPGKPDSKQRRTGIILKFVWVTLLSFSINWSQEKLEFEVLSMFWATGYEISRTGSQIDSIRFWNGSTINSPPDTVIIMGGVPSRKTLSSRATLTKWRNIKNRFEQALEMIRVTGFYEINNQSNLMDDDVVISDGWSFHFKKIENGETKELRYHCPNRHIRREDQIVARAWDILKEAEPSLSSIETSKNKYKYEK